ncbi:hypothetical protein HOY80DRAFT_1101430 [Tuber brumale]|nr:hypothetical protein HOY80DRAFT_1101430 [Tuber brumale]
MCCREALELLLSPQEQANDALGEIVELLCLIRGEPITPLLTHEQRPGVRHMTIDCGQVSIVWKVEMLDDTCYFRRITRYKRICRPIRRGIRKSRTFLMPVKIWEGPVCQEIIRLYRLGQLREDWWNYSILPRGQASDTIDHNNPGPSNDNGESQSGAVQEESELPQALDSPTSALSPNRRPELSPRLGLKKMRVGMRMMPMMRTLTKTMLVKIVDEMRDKGRLKVMRKTRMRVLGILRKRVTRVAAKLSNSQ